jgi:4-diphosphocytidyl-2-C-methyl-D-erythritol kinase
MSAKRGSPGKRRHARVQALAKVNLDLRVLRRREDGFHELRTIFQTISLADTLEIAFTPSRETAIELDDPLGIEDNLVSRAACRVLDALNASGRIEMRLRKRIPMGGGLGGGSSDAAAVLLALPALNGRPLEPAALMRLARDLGSDVPFFLLGGTVAAIGRGTELFPMPDAPRATAVLVAPGIHVETPAAYRALSARLTTESQENKIFSFQSHAWEVGKEGAAVNDFETVVFEQHSRLKALKEKLTGAGASVALMSGSGSAVFGLFETPEKASRALARLKGPSGLAAGESAYRVSLVGRNRYRSMWWRALKEYITPGIWPPRSWQK